MRRDRPVRGGHRARPWWRPVVYSAASVAAIAALFNPLPAAAAPAVPAAPPVAPAVPDPGSRPVAPGGLITLPGQATGATATTLPVATGVATTPLLQKIEKQRAAIAVLGDELIKLGEERDLARAQIVTADQKVVESQAALRQARTEAAEAASAAMRDAAALPPGATGSGLADLDALSRLQRGESATEESASRHLALAQAAQQAALAEQQTTLVRAADLSARYDRLSTEIAAKQAALQKLEQKNQQALTAAEAAESAVDRQLGAGYQDGTVQGRGADPRALAALTYALAQRGDPYEWSEEGPNSFDCSGLMFAAYRSDAAGNFPLVRVSRDQYDQTRLKSVDRYSLLPGDLLFFSSSTSWQGIHHVAMYAGNGMMVEAPRTGLDVRLVPVRWTRLFQATRVYGAVDGPTQAPDLGAPTDPNPGPGTTPPGTTPPGTTPPSSTPPSSTPPSSTPPSSTPPSSPTKPSAPSTPPTKPSAPSTPPVKPSTPSSPPSSSPATTPPSTSPSSSQPPAQPPASDSSPAPASPAAPESKPPSHAAPASSSVSATTAAPSSAAAPSSTAAPSSAVSASRTAE